MISGTDNSGDCNCIPWSTPCRNSRCCSDFAGHEDCASKICFPVLQGIYYRDNVDKQAKLWRRCVGSLGKLPFPSGERTNRAGLNVTSFLLVGGDRRWALVRRWLLLSPVRSREVHNGWWYLSWILEGAPMGSIPLIASDLINSDLEFPRNRQKGEVLSVAIRKRGTYIRICCVSAFLCPQSTWRTKGQLVCWYW